MNDYELLLLKDSLRKLKRKMPHPHNYEMQNCIRRIEAILSFREWQRNGSPVRR